MNLNAFSGPRNCVNTQYAALSGAMVKGNFSCRSRAANSAAGSLIWQNFEPIRDFMVVLVICKNEEDPIKNKGARVVTRLFIDFSNAQGQLTQ